MAATRIVPDEPIIDVIGASQYHLRVITLAGEVVFEKAISELRSLGLEDIVDNVSRSMGVLPHRLSLLCLFFVDTLQGTNISSKNGILKMIFLFPRWDMLIPWRVASFLFFFFRHFVLLKTHDRHTSR